VILAPATRGGQTVPGQGSYSGAMRQFLLYAVVRLGMWALLWWLLTVVGVGVMLAGVLAALIAMLISILFLDRLRDGAAMRWKDAHERRVQRRGEVVDEDAEYEDGLFADDVEIVTEQDRADEDAADEDGAGADPAGLPSLEEDPDPEDEGPETAPR
jgi:hypothetical protein